MRESVLANEAVAFALTIFRVVYRSLSDVQELGPESVLGGEDVVPGFRRPPAPVWGRKNGRIKVCSRDA